MQSRFKRYLFVAAITASPLVVQARDTTPPQPATPVASHDADNTRMNERDKHGGTATPDDQPNNSSDIALEASVRRAVVDDKSLSTLAHNIKIVTASGVVTLRGPVKSAEEKTQVAATIAKISGVSRVDNQLDIKR